MKMKKVLVTMLAALSFASICSAADTNAKSVVPTAEQVAAAQNAAEKSKIATAATSEKEKEAFFKHVQGKTIAVSYDSGFKFNIDYPEVGVLRWTPTTGLSLAPSDNEEYEVAEKSARISTRSTGLSRRASSSPRSSTSRPTRSLPT